MSGCLVCGAPRPDARLEDATARGVTLVCAPAGFGKTTVLGEWARSSRRRVAWLSLDSGDSDPARFRRYVAAALDGHASGIAQHVGALLRGPQQPSVEAVIISVINEAAGLDGEVVLVLDDYHLTDGAAVHDSVALLLERLPQQVRLMCSPV